MKKILAFFLAVTLAFGLCACAGSGAQSTESQPAQASLLAGFGRESINPVTPVGMGGYSDSETRKSGNILDNIYTTCVAFQEGEQTILIYTIEVCGLSDSAMDGIRTRITAATGVPGENIFIGATHTHSAPVVGDDQGWDTLFYNACINSAKLAIGDLAPIKMEVATTELENMNFVRHYEMNDGTYYGSNFGSTASGFKAHVADPDKQLILVKLDREEKKDILMVNWQAHPAAAARQNDYNGVSADFVGHMRTKVEFETGMQVAYYTGASGNLNPRSLIESENVNNNTSYQEYGKTLGQFVIDTLANLAPVEGTGIKTTRVSFEAEIDHSWDHMIAEATEVYELWKSEDKAKGDTLGATYGFTSVYQARAIRTRAALPATQVRELRAFCVGPIGFTTGTYEMFCDHAMYVKENSPFDVTFVISGNSGYIPNVKAYEYRSYESDTGMFASGTGEAMAEQLVELLKQLK